MPELDEDPGTAHYARVTPLGLEPADAVYTAQLNQNVIDMLMTKVESQAAEIARWQVAYRLVFEENEWRSARIEELESALKWMCREFNGAAETTYEIYLLKYVRELLELS